MENGIAESTKKIATDFSEQIWNQKDVGAIDRLTSDQVIIHSVLGDFHGKEALHQVVKSWLVGFPDLALKTLACLSENDLCIIHWEASGTHLGEFKGCDPTGKKVGYAGVTLYRIQDEKINEFWTYLDMQHLLQQIS